MEGGDGPLRGNSSNTSSVEDRLRDVGARTWPKPPRKGRACAMGYVGTADCGATTVG